MIDKCKNIINGKICGRSEANHPLYDGVDKIKCEKFESSKEQKAIVNDRKLLLKERVLEKMGFVEDREAPHDIAIEETLKEVLKLIHNWRNDLFAVVRYHKDHGDGKIAHYFPKD